MATYSPSSNTHRVGLAGAFNGFAFLSVHSIRADIIAHQTEKYRRHTLCMYRCTGTETVSNNGGLWISFTSLDTGLVFQDIQCTVRLYIGLKLWVWRSGQSPWRTLWSITRENYKSRASLEINSEIPDSSSGHIVCPYGPRDPTSHYYRESRPRHHRIHTILARPSHSASRKMDTQWSRWIETNCPLAAD